MAKTQTHVMDHTPYVVPPGKRVRLKEYDPNFTGPWKSKDEKEHAKAALAEDVAALAEAQEMLWANDRWAILLVFQAMDAAGKDGAIKHLMTGVNPQGCQVHSFKKPSALELDHDFLWRYTLGLPQRGMIGIFNRSYYEDVLVVRVHPGILAASKLPGGGPRGKRFWEARFEDINAYERHLTRNGTAIVKFFLHVSKEEQKKRFMDRLDEPEKHWKFSAADVEERAYWNDYMKAYEEAIGATSTEWAPWYIVPADNKWFTRACVADIVTENIRRLNLTFPTVSDEHRRMIEEARKKLESETR